MLAAESLTKKFGAITAVENASFEVRAEEIFGLVGPDGAGKTTLLRMLCGIVTPTGGRVIFAGDKHRSGTAGFGYMPQKFSLYGDLTVMENINFFGAMYRVDASTIRQRADEILEITGLLQFKNRFADNLSGGMKQKLALTCALLARPGILILDEPTYGVDPESRKDFWKILYHLNKDSMTIIVSTPYMDESELCHRIAFMDRGKIVAVETPGNYIKSFSYKILKIKTDAADLDFLNQLEEVVEAGFYGDSYHLAVRETEAAAKAITDMLRKKGVKLISIKEIAPSMEDIFIALTEKEVS
jgi:ABC-2 type transport system ATP-binding protein